MNREMRDWLKVRAQMGHGAQAEPVVTVTMTRSQALHVAHTLEYQSGGSAAWNAKSDEIAPLFRTALAERGGE